MNQWETQIVVSFMTVAGSFLVAYFTAKHKMKRDLVNRRFESYHALLAFLQRLKKDKAYRAQDDCVYAIRDIEVDIELYGSRHLINLTAGLRRKLEDTQGEYSRAYKKKLNQFQNEIDEAESGSSQQDSLIRERVEFELSRNDEFSYLLMRDSEVDTYFDAIVYEIRRSLGSRELRPSAWFRQMKIYKKIRFWT